MRRRTRGAARALPGSMRSTWLGVKEALIKQHNALRLPQTNFPCRFAGVGPILLRLGARPKN